MCAKLRFTAYSLGVVCTVAWLLPASHAVGQTPEKPVIAHGEITGSDVYVRSGSSANHYPVCKQNAGDRVTVVGETGDWYEILPPEPTFSFISADYVDTADDKTGVVNGDNVRIRAGSTLADFAELKYVVQTKVSKGAEVTILGRDADGFLRIRPPAGTTVWISRNFVEFVPDVVSIGQEETGDATVSPADTTEQPAAEPTTADKVDASAAADANDMDASPLADVPKTPLRHELEELDAGTREVLARPVVERDFGPLIERYRAVAKQEDDEFARRYAEARVDQLTQVAAVVDTVRRMRELGDQASSKRREFLEGRARIRELLPQIPSGVDAQGELRASALYPPGRPPCRYRLVDASAERERTIGYVEIPQGSTIDATGFLGRYVGVMASAKRLQTGGVDPVPIYVARDLILLQPAATTDSSLPD